MRAPIFFAWLVVEVSAQTWCGKNYMSTSPIVPPGGLFQIPSTSSTPLLALRCSPAIRPYLAEDSLSSSPDEIAILIDTPVTFSNIANAVPISLSHKDLTSFKSVPVSVSVSIDGKTLTTGTVSLNVTKQSLPFKLTALNPRTQAYNVTCSARVGSQTFEAFASLSYLPNPPPEIGSVTKMDFRTGALLARPANGKGGRFAPVFPIGFYTNFGGYLEDNFTIPATIKEQGFTVIHPIPSFDNLTALEIVLDKMQEAGLYLIYDMRLTYTNATAVTEEVNRIKSRPNLLIWYTGDEPDGTSDPLDATLKSSNLIQSLDGGDGTGGAGYHPVSLVLNCENYYYTDYASGADVISQDTYMIGNNVTFSSQWGTVCTPNYGDCGCDNCKGNFQDISTRMDEFRSRNFINGWELSKALWTVPQGFGDDTYWKRYPTGREFVVESVVGINHGGLGVISWNDPTTPEIQASASLLAKSLTKMNPFILNATASFRQITTNLVDIGLWEVDGETLVLASNTNYFSVSVSSAELGLSGKGSVAQILASGAQVEFSAKGFQLSFESVGTGGFIVKS